MPPGMVLSASRPLQAKSTFPTWFIIMIIVVIVAMVVAGVIWTVSQKIKNETAAPGMAAPSLESSSNTAS